MKKIKPLIITVFSTLFLIIIFYDSIINLVIYFGTSIHLGSKTNEIYIENINQRKTDTLFINLDKNQFVYKIDVRVLGNLSDSVYLNEKLLPIGVFDTLIINQGDWYSNHYIIKYSGNKKVSGSLKIQSTFYY